MLKFLSIASIICVMGCAAASEPIVETKVQVEPIDGPAACGAYVNAGVLLADRCELACIQSGSSSASCESLWGTNFRDVIAAKDCKDVTSVRDQKALFDQCLPWFATLSCDQLTKEPIMLDASCVDQFQGAK
jgi:hypothetical protein